MQSSSRIKQTYYLLEFARLLRSARSDEVVWGYESRICYLFHVPKLLLLNSFGVRETFFFILFQKAVNCIVKNDKKNTPSVSFRSQFTIISTIQKVYRQAQSHPSKKDHPRLDGYFNHQISAEQYTHHRYK
jgi:hypothetical protein